MSAHHTPESLSKMSLAELTALYNSHAAKPVKKFACSKELAIVKVMQVLPKAKAAPAKKSTGEKKPRGLGIGAYAKELLAKGEKPADVLVAVLKKFPEAKTTMKCLYWYSNVMRNA